MYCNFVVYRPFPTSNHNACASHLALTRLYIVRFLHQTTTARVNVKHKNVLYIVRFLHQTTTTKERGLKELSCISSVSYIKPQLPYVEFAHDTCCISSVSYIKPQPFFLSFVTTISCISSVSYIKPQLNIKHYGKIYVVYRPFPTSNHNFYQSVF